MAEHFLPTRECVEFSDLHHQLARGLAEDVLLADIPAEWTEVLTARGYDVELIDVVRRAIADGHDRDELTRVVPNCPELDGWAPALYFDKANGDQVIVSQQGIQTMWARTGDPINLDGVAA